MSLPRPIGALVAALLVSSSLVQPAAAASQNAGLFGSADPTYDGVFRQSLAIIALQAAGQKVPESAVDWLVSQQCSGGGFEAFRPDLGLACKAYSLKTYSGKDSNSTALAAVALATVGEVGRARAAVGYLARQQQADGGVPFGAGSASDAISTALTAMAVRATGGDAATVRKGGKSLLAYLRGNLLDCAAPALSRGAVSFQRSANLTADDMTSAQALAAMALWPVGAQQGTAATRLACPTQVKATQSSLAGAISGYVAARLVNNANAIPSAWGSGTDWASTAWAVIGLVGAGKAPKAVKAAMANLRANATTAIGAVGESVDPGRTALAILAARATAEDSRKFGGRNLVADLLGELRK